MARLRWVLLCSCVSVLLLHSSPTLAALNLEIQTASAEYREPEKFELSLVFRNDGDAPIIVLPQSLRREYGSMGSGAARYSPYPGPPIEPWRDAFLLGPGQSRTLTVHGMRDGDGVWVLEPGTYDLRLRLRVTPEVVEASRSQLEELGGEIWQGDMRSSGIRIRYAPALPISG